MENIIRRIDNAVILDDNVPQQLLPPPERLEWMITPEISQRMFLAAKAIDKRIADLDFFVYRYQGYGKNFIKSCKVSPDVYIQLCLQLAYFKWVSNLFSYFRFHFHQIYEFVCLNRLYGHLVATYESASTRRFKLVNSFRSRCANLLTPLIVFAGKSWLYSIC